MDSAQNLRRTAKNSPQPYFSRPNLRKTDPKILSGADLKFYKSVLWLNRIIFLGKSDGPLKNSQSLLTFDLEMMQWSRIKVAGSSRLAEKKEDYSVCVTQRPEIILCGYLNNSKKICVERLLMHESGEMEWVLDQENVDISCHSYHSSDILGDKMYVFGGLDQQNTLLNDLYEYSLVSGEWKGIDFKQTKPSPRYRHSTCIHQGNLFVFGGMNSNGPLNDLWSLNLRTLTWTPNSIRTSLAPSIQDLSFIFSFQQAIVVFGKTGKDACNEVFFFDTDSNQWDSTRIKEIPFASSSCSVSLYNHHQFMILLGSAILELPLNPLKFEDHENQSGTLNQQMKALFENKDYYDIKFQVEGKEIPAYKGILISRSPYFKNVFESGMKESHDQIIPVKNVKYDVYHKLIEFIYCEEIEISNEIAVDLLKLAHEYSLPSLIRRCGKCLARTIKNENFLELAHLAEDYHAEELQKHLLNYFLNSRQSLLGKFSPKELPRFLLERFMMTFA